MAAMAILPCTTSCVRGNEVRPQCRQCRAVPAGIAEQAACKFRGEIRLQADTQINAMESQGFPALGKKMSKLSTARNSAGFEEYCLMKEREDELITSVGPIRTLLLDNYDSYTFNLFQLLSVVNGVAPMVLKNDELCWRDLYDLLYIKRAFHNVVISPGPGSPTCAADIGICMQVLKECEDIPILGVCMGHQALGCAHGAKIIHAPEPVHGRLSEIEHLQHPLFNGIPSGSNFLAMRYHSLIVDANSLPKDLIPTAWTSCIRASSVESTGSSSTVPLINGCKFSEKKSCKGIEKILMGVSHRSWPHHGVQFHPESIATTQGKRLLQNFRDITMQYLKKQPDYLNRNKASLTLFGKTKPVAAPAAATDGAAAAEETCVKLRLSFRKMRCAASECGGCAEIFLKMIDSGNSTQTFWLDSSNTDQGRARFSYMGGRGGPLWQQITYTLDDLHEGFLRIEKVNGEAVQQAITTGFFDFLNESMRRFKFEEQDCIGLPFDFVGGFVGYLGYELKGECGAKFNRHKSSVPDAAMFMVDRYLVIDHANDDVYIVAVFEEDGRKDGEEWIERMARKIRDATLSTVHVAPSQPCPMDPPDFIPLKSKREYIEDVEKCLKYIRDGESYEICLTTQLKKEYEIKDPLRLYLVLREVNPAPYAAWMRFDEEGPVVCCSSPERFLQLNKAGVLEAKPIKGTMPRGETSAIDDSLKRQLETSEKDRAENLMIVDLLRNDLGRVCVAGSVNVPNLMAVESYSTVHTLVSTVRGEKREDVSAVECVRAAFPGGSMTGAPKLRSMEIIDSIEKSARGIYSVIRTMVVIKGEEIWVGAGGAVVALSHPETEYQEMLLKTKAPINAIQTFAQQSQ